MRRHRFAAFWATVLVVIGLLLVVGGVRLAGAAVTLDMPWGSLTGQAVLERMLAAILLVISGLLAGAPFIALGEMMRLFIHMRSEEHTSELQSHRDLHSFPTRRSSDLCSSACWPRSSWSSPDCWPARRSSRSAR